MESLVLRPARADDREGMLRVTRGVWEGSDYVPYVWQRWLEDPSGYLCVAAMEDRLVGLQHVGLQPDGSAWMEGIRVDETVRGQGIGAAMLIDGLEWSRRAGCTVARLSTSNENVSSMRLARKAGLREIGRFDVLSGPATDAPAGSAKVRLAHAGDIDRLSQIVLPDHRQDGTSAFYTEGWTAFRLSVERLHLLVAVHAVAIVESRDAVGVGIATASVGRPYARLGYLHGSSEGVAAVAAWIQAQSGGAGMQGVRAIVPSQPATRAVLRSLGFTAAASFSMVLWEKQLERANPVT